MSGKDEWMIWCGAQGVRPVAFFGDDDGEAEGDGGEGDDDGAAPKGSLSEMLDHASDGEKDGDKGEADGDWSKIAAKLGVDAEHIGKTPEDTVKALQGRIKGFRDQIGKGKKAGEVPETAEGYEIEADGEDDIVAPYLNAEENTPILNAFREAALARGMDKGQFAGFLRDGLSAAHDGGLIDLRDGDTVIAESAQQEMETLSEQIGASEAVDMANSVINFGKELVDQGTIPKEWQNEFNVMCGTAEATQIMYNIMTGKMGLKAQPHGDPIKGAKSVDDANDAYRAALAMKPGAERDTAVRAAEKDVQKANAHLGQGTSVPLEL